MTNKPTIVTVDDDPQVLNAVKRDLQSRYAADYRIVAAPGGPEGLELARQLKQRGDRVALFLVDQRMPDLEGTELLAEVRTIFPHAAKVLLTAYADTDAAIAAINEVDLDHYLMKPWDPPDQKLYPVLDDVLEEWVANAPATFEGIRVVGARYSRGSHETKEWMQRNQVPYRWLDIDRESEARALLDATDHGRSDLPLVFFDDGETLAHPDIAALAAKTGKTTEPRSTMYDLVIIGAGPAGLGAAVYGAAEGLKCALIESHAPGGQAGTSSRIENYLGFPKGISGEELARRADSQVQRLGCEVLCPATVESVRVDDTYRYVTLTNGTELACRALLIATGMTTRELDKPGVKELTGLGVYYGATLTEATSAAGEHVVVLGGANSAGQGAMEFSRHADKVTMLIRGPSIEAKMSAYLIEQIAQTDNVEVLLNTELAAAHGDESLESVTWVNNQTGEETTIDTAAVFIFVGTQPHSRIVEDIVELDDEGCIVTGTDLLHDGRRPAGWPFQRDPRLLETSVPGIFAAGDIQHGAVRRVASAVGMGAVALTLIYRYLSEV